MATFWVYDYACSLHEEWPFLLRSHWNKVKGLYVATRYLPFILLTTNLYMNFTPNETPSRCRVLANVDSGSGMVSVILSECIYRPLYLSDLIHPGKEDYITRHPADWYKQSRFRDKFDIHLCAYSTLLRIVGRFHDDIFSDPTAPTGLNKGINFLQVTLEHDRHLTNYFEEWTRRFNEESDPGDPGSVFQCTLLPFLVSYSRLVMYSFGFQHAFQPGMEASDNVFLDKCFDSAKVVIKQMIEVLVPSGLMRHFIFASFVSAFMLKLLRPEFAQLLTRQMEDGIFKLIGRLITTLQDVAIDERHTPRLYARFLSSLLTRHRKGGGSVGGHAGIWAILNQACARNICACAFLLRATSFLSQVLVWYQSFALNVHLVPP
ncbi:hypothetical protein BD769DRAFT_1784827 [Suillus cothurnatus]|nr:hypothetical protein BD769DRAFT_1784827 [Suillus cothurnatus]